MYYIRKDERGLVWNPISWSCITVFLFLQVTAGAYAQIDPGIRGGAPGAGLPFTTGLTGSELAFFNDVGVKEFNEIEQVEDGLGPRFNLDSCAGCHLFPAIGGSSPPMNNPLVMRAPTMAPGSTVPSFLKIDGPIREVRFIRQTQVNSERGRRSDRHDDEDEARKSNAPLDGQVHNIFTIVGRSDNPEGCKIKQPDFSDTRNMIFRIPTPLFGLGLIESITDATIKNNLASDPTGLKRLLGIRGSVNTNGNDGTVTRFGWKAQNKSLLLFSGEAYNVEMGVTNEFFPNERSEDPKCATNPLPENRTGFGAETEPSNLVAFMTFVRFMDQPTPACGTAGQPTCSPSVVNGRALFEWIGCSGCHTPSLPTGLSYTDALNQKQAKLFSDLALHHMGSGLADDIIQGKAGPDEFRTAPLWGIGQRAFFLHDGRTNDLLKAIYAHASPGSEASRVIGLFHRLTASQRQDILNFLRSL